MQAREYQIKAVSDLRAAISRGNRRPLLVMPTGSGKTIVASMIVRSAVEKGKRALFLAPRRELIHQTSDKLKAIDVHHGIMMAGEVLAFDHLTQIASVPTIYKRCFKDGEPVQARTGGKYRLPPADLIIVDEAHANFSNMAQLILAQYPKAVVIGMTATPARSDGRGLGEIYDEIVHGPSVADLTEGGFLVPARYFTGSKADLSKVKMLAGDYNKKQLGEAVNKPKLVGDVVSNWARICPERTTVVFAVNRGHAGALDAEFRARGFESDYLDGETDYAERSAKLRKLETGETRVLCTVDVLSYGWDCPPVSCGIIARPTKSIARYLQMAGRLMRPWERKEEFFLIDHGTCVDDFGPVDEDREWQLEGKALVEEFRSRRAKNELEKKQITCASCDFVFPAAKRCPSCGMSNEYVYRKAIESLPAELQEVLIEKKSQKQLRAEQHKYYCELLWIRINRGYKPGWAAHKYRARYGKWPRFHENNTPIQPSFETVNRIRKRK